MCVRSSNGFYAVFNLDMGRSPGFGSTETDSLVNPFWFTVPFSDLISLRLHTWWYLTLPVPITRRTVLQKVRSPTFHRGSTDCKHKGSGSFSLPSWGSFHHSFTVLYTIGHWGVFSLGGWSPRLPTRFLVSRGTLDSAQFLPISPTGLSPCLAGFPKTIRLSFKVVTGSPLPQNTRILVWALSLSLATT